MSAAKDSFSQIEELFVENAKGFLTYEKLVKLLDKAPTATIVKKIEQLAKTNKVQLITSAEAAKLRNLADAKKNVKKNAQKKRPRYRRGPRSFERNRPFRVVKIR